MRTLFSFFFAFIYTFSIAQTTALTPQQMKADLDYLNKYLRKWHPTYYDYTPKSQMEAYYKDLKDSCTATTSGVDFRVMVRKAVDKIGCGHTGVYGAKSANSVAVKKLPIFPVDIWVLNNRIFVKSPDSLVTAGDEILAINGEKTSDLIPKLKELAFTDGLNQTHKRIEIERSFAVYMYFLYGKQDTFVLETQNKLGETKTINLQAKVPKDEPKKGPLSIDSSNRVIKGDAVNLYKTDFDTLTMTLDIDNFNGAKQGKTFKKVFTYLRENKTKNLIIDLRDNGGGDVFKGNKLLTYILDESIIPMNFSRKPNLTVINPRFKAQFWERMTPVLFMLNPLQYPNKNGWNHCFLFFKKRRNHFDGKVYVMTNGGTFSMASYVASYLKHRKQATIVGEETGGSEYASRAAASGRIELPNSGIKVHLNVYQMKHFLNIEDKAQGVLPDYPTAYSIEDKLSEKDLELETIKNLVKK